jgi:hypothetical protein
VGHNPKGQNIDLLLLVFTRYHRPVPHLPFGAPLTPPDSARSNSENQQKGTIVLLVTLLDRNVVSKWHEITKNKQQTNKEGNKIAYQPRSRHIRLLSFICCCEIVPRLQQQTEGIMSNVNAREVTRGHKPNRFEANNRDLPAQQRSSALLRPDDKGERASSLMDRVTLESTLEN